VSQQRTLEQKRAKGAWQNIAQVKGESYQKEYGSLVRRAPADIQINGLGQTLAFWRAKGKHEHNTLYKHVSDWVMTRLGKQHQQGLLAWITLEATTDQYRQATAEAMAFLLWLKRFAEAELRGD
jgi:CRISPR-associated protein Cmr5